ncbi:putative beta-lysine N-acetyltransferase [uncultured Bacteroides sp.]|uniref:putative beta-lysine N-acetyltransferase n=1 Tax=uncultured Bacteroides sp. TaxID=162156 RepID=UPI002AAB7630|nr:putative beta-lysine N-acetyltransferase [uncultured Bacteroides sp.]
MKETKKIFQSHLSHNKENNRIYLMEMHTDDFPEIINHMDILARANNYTKLFAKVPAKYGPTFIRNGYFIEACIPGFYNGQEDAMFLMKYSSEERKQPESKALAAFQDLLLQPSTSEGTSNHNCVLQTLKETDITEMISIFKKVFPSYPFPIFDPDFILKSMKEEGTRYFGAFYKKKLIAISSAECNTKNKNAEMTDFAVLPEHRGKKLATHLLSYMEQELSNDGYLTFYTIARLHSLAMNKTFYNMGYKYSGTLTRNTQIAGNIESMNVWYKRV